MGVQIKNNAYSTLLVGINSTATSISLAIGEGARFPAASVASGNYFYVTLLDISNNIEIVKVTNRTTDTLTVVRGQDGTTAQAFALGDRVELRVTAALLGDLPIRQMQTADYADVSITSAKLATTGVSAGNFGGKGKSLTATVNSKGQLTAITEANGYVQRNQYDFTTTGAVQAWTKPTNAGSLVHLQMWGGGGGGARCSNGAGGGGGGGGGYFEQWFHIDELSSSASIVVGEGGAGATTDNVEGSVGTTTTFTSGSITRRAYPGGGGSANGATTVTSGGGGGGGELEAGKSADNTGPGRGGGIGGGHGGEAASGDATAASKLRGSSGITYTELPVSPAWLTNDARSIWGGGGGGGGNAAALTGSESAGGYAVYGGGGGGGGYNGAVANDGAKGGTSLFGGAGGNGQTASVAGGNGATPGGGGGGTETAIAGSGGNGRCIVTVY
jgi:hypothetical protein